MQRRARRVPHPAYGDTVTARASRRLRVSAHRFWLRRAEAALLYGDPDDDAGSVAAPRLWYAVGVVASALIVAVRALVPVLWPTLWPT